MTVKELVHDLSGAALSDELILSSREKELLVCLLEQARTHRPDDIALTETITQAVGEVVAQRAFRLLGSSITEQLAAIPLNGRSGSIVDFAFPARSPEPPSPKASPEPPSPKTSPEPPSPKASPEPPSPKRSPEPPSPKMSPEPPSPKGSPEPPSPKGSPEPPSPKMSFQPPSPKTNGDVQRSSQRANRAEGGVAVLDMPQIAAAECVVFDEFLAPAEVAELIEYALAQEDDFRVSQVVSPGVQGGAVDFEYRRSRVLMELGKHQEVIVNRIQSCLPRILDKLGIESFPISRIEAQITASGDGDFFRWHTDDGHAEVASREITFVYFFHREPKSFRGGELRIYESELHNGAYRPTSNSRTIVPQQNQAVFFASALAHEITPVECPSGAFADSRFTVNGWFHR